MVSSTRCTINWHCACVVRRARRLPRSPSGRSSDSRLSRSGDSWPRGSRPSPACSAPGEPSPSHRRAKAKARDTAARGGVQRARPPGRPFAARHCHAMHKCALRVSAAGVSARRRPDYTAISGDFAQICDDAAAHLRGRLAASGGADRIGHAGRTIRSCGYGAETCPTCMHEDGLASRVLPVRPSGGMAGHGLASEGRAVAVPGRRIAGAILGSGAAEEGVRRGFRGAVRVRRGGGSQVRVGPGHAGGRGRRIGESGGSGIWWRDTRRRRISSRRGRCGTRHGRSILRGDGHARMTRGGRSWSEPWNLRSSKRVPAAEISTVRSVRFVADREPYVCKFDSYARPSGAGDQVGQATRRLSVGLAARSLSR